MSHGRDLRLLAAAVLLSALGDLLATVTLAVRVHDLTGSGFAVAAFFAASTLPVVLLAPVAGALVDRCESVRVLVVASLAQAVLAAALAFVSDLGPILALSALLAAGAAVSQPAEFTLVPAAARGTDLTRANGLVESARYAGHTLGPLLAAALTALGGTEAALLVNAASFVAIAGAAAALRVRRPPEPHVQGERARDGIVALRADPVLRIVLGAAVGALVVISTSWTVEVFYVKDVLHAGDAAFGVLVAVWMIGMVGGALGLAPKVPAAALASASLVALAVQGAGMAAQTIAPLLAVACAGYVVGGIGHGAKNTLLRTLIQQRVPGRLHGRAFAAYSAGRNAAELVAFGLGGVLVGVVGARDALLIAGLGPVAAALAGLALLRARPAGGRGMSLVTDP